MAPQLLQNTVGELVPSIGSKDVDILMKNAEVDADVLNNSEELTAMWIQAYLEEIQRVESFFGMKMDMLVDEFILMQDKFRLKSELYETEQEVKKKKKQKKLE